MKILELFDSRDKKKRLSHIANLLAMAGMDGNADERELAFINSVVKNKGVTLSERNRILTRPKSVKFYVPESNTEKLEQLFDLVLVMIADGEIHENEKLFCKVIATNLGFKEIIVDLMIEIVLDAIDQDLGEEYVIKKLEDLL
ncbi:hypothetical protein OBJ92_08535 [Empedobacter falsenii]